VSRAAPDLTGRPTETVQRLRIRFAKRGRLRFTSHRDVARAFERALRRAAIPLAYSSGFTAHPRVSWVGAAPTGVASEAEYLEIGLAERRDPEQVRLALDAALPPGLDVLTCVEGSGPALADRIDASEWAVRLPGVTRERAQHAVEALLAAPSAPVEKLTKSGRKTVDVRAAVVSAAVLDPAASGSVVSQIALGRDCAILGLVVQQTTPAVRPDDVLAAFRTVAGLEPQVPPEVTRLGQGRLVQDGLVDDTVLTNDTVSIDDPLAAVQDGARPVG
jgi:radical SAM-linked protein